MHEHRRLGVPVRLGADVDAGDDDVDLVAGLGELDEPAQHGGDPVHVLGAAVHRDAGAGGQREPLERHAERLGQVEGGDDAPALGLGQRTEGLGGVAEERDTHHALRVAVGDGGDEADDDAGGVPAGRPIDRDEPPVGVEVVLLERTARDVGAPARPRRDELLHQLVRVRRSPAAGLHDLLGVLVEGQQRLGRQVVLDDDEPRPGRVGEADESFPQLAGRRVRAQALHPDLLDAEPLGGRGQAAGDPLDLVDGEVERRPDVQLHAVPLVAAFGRAAGPGPGACPRGRRAAPARAAAGRRSVPRRRVRVSGRGPRPRRAGAGPWGCCGRRRGQGRRSPARAAARRRSWPAATTAAARP